MKGISLRKPLPGLAVVMALLLAACGSPAPPPTASITLPAANAQFRAGDEVRIEGRVTGSAIRQVDVFINNQKYATVDQPIGPDEFAISVNWIAPAEMAGTSVIQLKGVNDRGESVIASDAVFITIQPPQPAPTPTSQPTPIPTVAPAVTETPEALASPATATADSGAAAPTVLLSPRPENDYVNVRAAPDLTAQQIGQINKGQSVPVRGRNADGTWYQVNFPSGPNGTGWVFAAVANVTGVTASLPVVAPAAASQPVATAPTNPSGLRPPFVKLRAGQDFANVRSGPDTAYQKVGELVAAGVNAAAVRGKSANGQWWQIEFAGAPGGVAWVYSQLVDLTGDAGAVPIAAAPPLPTGAVAAAPTPTLVPVGPQPTPTPPIPASAVLPYSQNVRFSPRDDIGDVPLGHQGQPKTATLEWQINGAVKAELEITTQQGPGIFENCLPGNLSSITPNSAVGKRMPMLLPSGTFQFTIPDKGYYLFKIYVVKSDGSTTDIPRNVIVDCYKTQ